MTSIRYDFSVVDEPSFAESINHPSFIKTHDSPSMSHVSSPSSSLVRSANRSPQVTGIRHPSSQQPTTNSTDEPSSPWSFQYDEFEQQLLQDTSPPHSVSGNILASPRSTYSNQVPTARAATETTSTTPPPPLDKDASTFLFDNDYPPETRERIERSFNEQFGLQSATSSSHHRHSIISQHSNSQVSHRHMTDMMENKCLQMQESLSSRIQVLEDKFNKTYLQSSNSSQRSRSVLSTEMNNSSTSNGNNDQVDNNDGDSQQQQQQQQGDDINQAQKMMDLQHFVDRVDALVWNTPFLSPADTIKSAHICDRHRAWSEQILRERQKSALDSLDARDRMEATLQQLIQWADSIRNHQPR